MADPGSEFRPRARREARQFEPPPWERAEFDRLARERAEDEAAQAAVAAVAEAAQAASTPDMELAQAAPADAPVLAVAAEPAEVTEAQVVTADEPAAKPAGPDPAKVTELMAGLAAEEPSAHGAYWKASVAAGTIVVVLGVMFVTWGVVALVRSRGSGVAGVFGGSVLVMFGGGFVVGGLYVVLKNLRQQGVL